MTASASTISVKFTRVDDLVTRAGRKSEEQDLLVTDCMLVRAVARFFWDDAGRAEEVSKKLTVVVNGTPLDPTYMAFVALMDGDEVLVSERLGDPIDGVLIAIALASAFASAVLINSMALPAANGSGTPAEKRFGFSRFSNDAIAGGVRPVVLGHRVRYGGQIISKVPVENDTGDGDSRLKLLVFLSDSRIYSVGNQAADFDRVPAGLLSGIFLNDQAISSFPDCYVSGRMGTVGQAVIPGFSDIEVPREVGVGGVSLVNTGGSERTGASASGEAFTFSTLNAVNAVRVRVRLPGGLFQTSTTTQLEPARVKWRARTRTSDVGGGAGAWSAWTLVDQTKAEQSEFISALRLDNLNGGVAAKTDVQVERVSIDAVSLLVSDKLLWDTCVEVTHSDLTFDGMAVLALDLAASQQLTSVPKVSVDILGSVVRVWDGVSPPSSPVFTLGYTANAASLALECITNKTWGMGALYSDANVDFVSLFEFLAECDVATALAAGGTRPKFACNLVIDSEKTGVEWLRTICRAGRCTPVTSGGVWRFVQDRAQGTPVETFTDGSIAVDGNGVAMFEVSYEHTTGGINRANQMTVQFENELAQGRSDVIVWPESGDQWLGTPLNETIKSTSVKLDGVTHPEQVFAELVYMLKRERFLGRAVKLTSTRPVLVTQPGDRFDVAMSLPGWGLASGRLEVGSSADTLRLDRTVTLLPATTYYARVMQGDGSIEDRAIAAASGTYAPGDAIALASPLAQAPQEFSEYAIGTAGVIMKPFTATVVRPGANLQWELEGVEYAADVYNPEDFSVTLPDYSTLNNPLTAPGPVINLRAFESLDNGQVRASLSWQQTPTDRANTASFRVYRRSAGTGTWVLFPLPSVSSRGVVFDIQDDDRAYEFTVIAVSQGGAALSPYDPRVPIVPLVFGLSALPPDAPGSLTITGTGGNAYKLTWPAVTDAVGYQVLFGGAATSLPNVGAEDCLVLARTVDPQLLGLELPPGRSCTFWVRSVGSSGRLSFTAATAVISSPATPAGESIKQTKVFDLSADGTLTNLAWNAGTSRLELVSTSSPGVWLSPEVDPGSLTMTEISLRPQTANDADDVAINTDPFTAPSIAADQWGLVTLGPPKFVGMLMPPWPDDRQAWLIEVRTHDGTIWGGWETIAPCGSVRRVFQKWQVRVTMTRASAPYRPGLAGMAAVLTN